MQEEYAYWYHKMYCFNDEDELSGVNSWQESCLMDFVSRA